MTTRLLVILAIIVAIIGGMFFAVAKIQGLRKGGTVANRVSEGGGGGGSSSTSSGASGSSSGGSSESSSDPLEGSIEKKLEEVSKKVLADIDADSRLNLKMVAQLRAYKEVLKQLHSYAQEVEQDLNIIEQISKDAFQEDVKLQASLFAGKKPELVAGHLEKFRSSRVGAILAKMKDKEASAVMDVWAKAGNPKVSAFYQEVMGAYLNNKRRDANPDLFKAPAEREPEEDREFQSGRA